MSRIGCLVGLLIVLSSGCVARDAAAQAPAPDDGVYLLIRSDDAGMTHAVNAAIRKLLETGLPVSVSVMFPTPWYQEIVEILREHPETSVGVHLTLNSEWRHYRWGPVIGREAAPSLVDKDGFFFHSAQLLYDNEPDLGELERELRAQIERALGTGLRIDYLDFHMGTARRHPDFRAIVDRLGSEYGLGLSGAYGERMHDPQYRADPEAKADSLIAMLARLEPGYHVVITHPGLDTPEMGALVDLNVHHPLENMSSHRQGELDALTSDAFAAALRRYRVTLITYRDLLERTRSVDRAVVRE